jgi:ferredoxin
MDAAGFLPRADFPRLLDRLTAEGYRCIGPQVRDGAIVYGPLASAAALPYGWHDRQGPGSYRLERDDSPRCFAWANGAQALKPLLFAPSETLWRVERDTQGQLRFTATPPPAGPLAVIGVRACDLAALALHDLHFRDGPAPDPAYVARRHNLFLVAVHCAHPAATCFCASTGDGPRATQGFDLALSELDDGFLVEIGSEAGRRVATQLPLRAADGNWIARAAGETAAATGRQTRRLPSRTLRDALFAQLGRPRWDKVAERCLACGNCTSVCPTCFCHAEHEDAAFDGCSSRHVREWDSCFAGKHSAIHGVTIRSGTRERYRQWLTHKLAGWHDQYGRSGCTGCGRCIAWCPVGIDITEEAAALLAPAK